MTRWGGSRDGKQTPKRKRPIVVNSFELAEIACMDCGATQAPAKFGATCPSCGGGQFRVEIERSASGMNGENILDALWGGATVGGGAVGEFVNMAMSDDEGSGLYFRTFSHLTCTGVSGAELSGFLGAAIEERRRTYVGWKRRELEAHLAEGQRICERCKVLFKVYDNDWNKAGLCSKSCYHGFMKSRGKGP